MLVHTIDFDYFDDYWQLRFNTLNQTAVIRILCYKSDYGNLGIAVTDAIKCIQALDSDFGPGRGRVGHVQPSDTGEVLVQWQDN